MRKTLRCEKCGRWLGEVGSSARGLVVKCPNCKHNTEFEIVFLSVLDTTRSCYTKGRRSSAPKDQKATVSEPTVRSIHEQDTTNSTV